MRQKFKCRRGVSEVIASIILTAVVLTVGGAVWSYAQSATIVLTNHYVNETLTVMKDVTERFVVEHVSNDSASTHLYVWVYNYGGVDIVADVYANATRSSTSILKFKLGTTVTSGDMVKIDVSFVGNALQSGDKVAIKVHSRRQNNAFFTYYMP
jgi:flagellin-like protein